MNIDLKDIVTLDAKNEYFVAGKHQKDNNTYYYLVNINDYSDIRVVKLKIEGEITKLIDVNDEVLLKELSVKFLRQSRDMLNDIKNEQI